MVAFDECGVSILELSVREAAWELARVKHPAKAMMTNRENIKIQ